MKKMALRLSSLLLLVAFCLSLSPTSLALGFTNSTDNMLVSSNEIVLPKQNGHATSILCEDLSNGDAQFSLLEDGNVVSASYVDRSNHEIIWTKFQNGVAVMSETKSYAPITESNPRAASGYTNVGAVKYNHYVQGMIMTVNSINWSYSTNTNTASAVDLNGYYRDLADFAASILGLLSMFSTASALQVASAALTGVGLAGGPGAIFFPEYKVDCVRTEVVWRAYTASKQRLYQGCRCVVTHPDHLNQTVFEGDYYPTTAIADHNEALARDPYLSFYPGGDWYEIKSWPS